MDSKYSILLTIVLLSCYSTGAYGLLSCYTCNSYRDLYNGKACIDPMSSSVPHLVCPNGYICSKVSYVAQKTFVTSRSCDPPIATCQNIKNTMRGLYPDLSNFKCHTCSSNLCNSGVTLKVSLSFFTLATIVMRVF